MSKVLYFFVAGNENDINNNNNANNIIFTIKDKKLYFPVAILSVRDNEKLSKFLRKRFKRLVYWNEYKTKTDDINTAK